MPLLLDDPFATTDDERLRTGVHALAEVVASGHPCLLVTCHRGRLRDLRAAGVYVTPEKEIVALIAYLQRLGSDLKRSTP